MFSKIEKTAFPPSEKPVMVWDGNCGFCHYWITRWKSKTGDRINYKAFQEAADQFQDIPLKEFKKASRLIEPNGLVYSGPDSAYRSFTYFEDEASRWHTWYIKSAWFTFLSDHAYNFIAKNRNTMFVITKICFGKDPTAIKPYWFIILFFIFTLIIGYFKFL